MTENSLPADAVFCDLGTSSPLSCCSFSRDGLSSDCFDWLEPTIPCYSGNCVRDCQNYSFLYDPPGPTISHSFYSLCVALPSLYGVYAQGLISSDVMSQISPALANATFVEMKAITDATTHCLLTTCDQARNSSACKAVCSPTSLLVNSTTPSMDGIFECLTALCETSPITSATPFANADIAGIGVYVSYFTQCALALLAWSALTTLEIVESRAKGSQSPNHWLRQKERIVTAIVEFHKAQCFFTIPVMIAALFSGIFRRDALNVFTLLPIALNSVAPLQLVLFMIVYCARFSRYLVLLTAVSWVLASIVYWVLYSQLPHAPVSAAANYQIQYKYILALASAPTCGGYSGLSVCPDIWYEVEFESVSKAQSAFLYSPWVWTWYAFCFAALLAVHGIQMLGIDSLAVHLWRKNRAPEALRKQSQLVKAAGAGLFWTGSLICVALVCVQLYFLSLAFDLSLIDVHDWGFGQIIAVTVWLPPIVEYVQLQINGVISGSKYRFAKTLSIVRVSKRGADRVDQGQTAKPSQTSNAASVDAKNKAPGVPVVRPSPLQLISDDSRGDTSHPGSSATTPSARTGGQHQFTVMRSTTVQLEEGRATVRRRHSAS